MRLPLIIRRLRRQTKRMIIVFVAALVLAFVASIIASLLDRPFKVYYPHDEEIIIERSK